MATTLKHIANCCRQNDSLTDIKTVIDQYLIDNKLTNDYATADDWIAANKWDLVRWSMPSIEKIILNILKERSSNTTYESEGISGLQTQADNLTSILDKFA